MPAFPGKIPPLHLVNNDNMTSRKQDCEGFVNFVSPPAPVNLPSSFVHFTLAPPTGFYPEVVERIAIPTALKCPERKVGRISKQDLRFNNAIFNSLFPYPLFRKQASIPCADMR